MFRKAASADNYGVYSAMVTFALDTLWRRNVMWLLPNMGFRKVVQSRVAASQDEIEFGALTSGYTG